jgi:TRAP-type C4-dicarboxylate transport system permease small subunit
MVRRAIDLVGLLFSLYIVWFGVDITRLVLASGQTSPTLGVSNAVLYLSLPVGFALLSARYGASLLGVGDRWSANDGAAGAGH